MKYNDIYYDIYYDKNVTLNNKELNNNKDIKDFNSNTTRKYNNKKI